MEAFQVGQLEFSQQMSFSNVLSQGLIEAEYADPVLERLRNLCSALDTVRG